MLTDILINVNEPIHNCDLVSYYVVVDGMAKEIPLAAVESFTLVPEAIESSIHHPRPMF